MTAKKTENRISSGIGRILSVVCIICYALVKHDVFGSMGIIPAAVCIACILWTAVVNFKDAPLQSSFMPLAVGTVALTRVLLATDRISIILELAATVTGTVILILCRKKLLPDFMMFICLFILSYITGTLNGRIDFVGDGEKTALLWSVLPTLIITAAVVAFLVYINIRYDKKFPKEKKPNILLSLLKYAGIGLLAALIFGIYIYSSISQMNYAFDLSRPQTVGTVITEKENHRTAGRYGRTRYCLTLNNGGEEIQLEVYWSEYDRVNEGDNYLVHLHEGAFGLPYYISAEND